MVSEWVSPLQLSRNLLVLPLPHLQLVAFIRKVINIGDVSSPGLTPAHDTRHIILTWHN